MSSKLVLASGSRYKQSLLARLGIPFTSQSADVDESRRVGELPDDLALRLARDKALAVQTQMPNAWVLGVDQVIALGDNVFSKPGSFEAACKQLQTLSGHTHELITAMVVVSPDGEAESLTRFEMAMRTLSDAAIEAYVTLDEPFDCAGAYKIEEAGIRLFDSCSGPDFTAIIGLACTRVIPMLQETGFWSGNEDV